MGCLVVCPGQFTNTCDDAGSNIPKKKKYNLCQATQDDFPISLVGGLLSMGLPRLVSSSCLSPHVPGSAPCPGHWTLDTGH